MQWVFILIVAVYLLAMIALANHLDSRKNKRTVRKQRVALAYPYRVEDDAAATSQPTAENGAADDTNQKGASVLLTLMLFGVIGVLLLTGANALIAATMPAEMLETDLPDIVFRDALIVAGLGVLSAMICGAVVVSRRVRAWLDRAIGKHGTFDPDSSVHKTAFVLAVAVLSYTLMDIIIVGGVEGYAEALQEQSIGTFDAIANLLLMVVVAFVGVGILIRRTLAQVFERLSLRSPTVQDALWGIGTAFLCLIAISVFSAILMLVLSPEALEAQGAASNQIAQALSDSLLIAFLAAFAAAVGEEILFRGALQPVFGLIPTTLFFALLHTQYAFTPGSAAILIVGAAFGILRQRQSTTAAIIAHFTYNFVLLAVAVQMQDSGLLSEAAESLIYVTSLISP